VNTAGPERLPSLAKAVSKAGRNSLRQGISEGIFKKCGGRPKKPVFAWKFSIRKRPEQGIPEGIRKKN
jgi:hypothetical protein